MSTEHAEPKAPVDALVRCPFCGCDEPEYCGARVSCPSCGCLGPLGFDDDVALCRRLWNRRKFDGKAEWQEIFVADIHAWGDHNGIDVRDVIDVSRPLPLWQQVRQLLNRLID